MTNLSNEIQFSEVGHYKMDFRLFFFISTLSLVFILTSACDRVERNVGMQQEAKKSGEKIRITTPSKDKTPVSCSAPAYKCCEEKQPTVSSDPSYCLREDNTIGVCCIPKPGVLSAEWNETKLQFQSTKDEEELEKSVGNVARVIAKNKAKEPESTTIDDIERL